MPVYFQHVIVDYKHVIIYKQSHAYIERSSLAYQRYSNIGIT